MHRIALQAYRTINPAPGARRPVKRHLQQFADLVITPPSLPAGKVNAIRLYFLQGVIADAVAMDCPRYALEVAQLATAAPADKPFNISAADVWQMFLDQKRAQRGEVAA